MKTLPPSEQPYEKALKYGVGSLSDGELLAAILRTGARDSSAKDLAEKILTLGTPDGLAGLLHYSLEDYKSIKGVGNVKAIQLSCIGELSKRIWRASGTLRKWKFTDPSHVADYCMEEMRHMEEEHVRLLILNTKNALIKDVDLSKGTVNGAPASPREIFIEILRHRGVGFIIAHNHPSGDASPSKEDCAFTLQVQEAGKLMGIPLLDHIIIGDNTYVSLRERGIVTL